MYNVVTRKWYIGQSVWPHERFKQHMSPARFNNNPMVDDAEKYGKDSFKLIVFRDDVPFCWAGIVEQAWFDSCAFWCNMYNVKRPSEKGNLGRCKYKSEDFDAPLNGSPEDFFPETFFREGAIIKRSFLA